jgi:hypothetical protein
MNCYDYYFEFSDHIACLSVHLFAGVMLARSFGVL